MQPTLIDQGFNLMLFGMGTVFVFLTILVFATSQMSKIVLRFTSEKEVVPVASTTPPIATNKQPDQRTLTAIQKAITAHRQR